MEKVNIYSAFLAAQKSMSNAVKGSNNPFFKSKYADLNAVREAVMPSLIDNGICLIQPEVVIDGRNYVRTVLHHCESGTEIYSDVEILMKSQNDPQAMGSAITYARRYGLQSICGIGAEDDDTNLASQKSKVDKEADMKEQNMLNNVAMCTTIQEAKELCAKYKGEFRNVNLLLEVYKKKEKELNNQ